jgi:glyoxylase-like metal-dependent hydrolase (beta-lactamase superfamily II)
MPFIMQAQSLSEHVDMIDVQGWDFHHTTGVLIIQGQDVAIIETGHHRCGKQILDALSTRQIPVEKIRYVCVTHRHGDHCGGATPIAKKAPNATVVGHKYAIAALHDPSRLNEGARQLFGEFAQDIHPLPHNIPVRAVQDGERINLGDKMQLQVIGTPGHTSDHLAFFEEQTRTLYTGDALGLLGPKHYTVMPTSFPPSFKYDLYKASIEKLRTYDPKFVVFSHFGAVTGADIPVIFDRALITLESWKETVEQAWNAESTQIAVMNAIKQRFLDELEVFPPAARPLFIQVMAQGLARSLIPKDT